MSCWYKKKLNAALEPLEKDIANAKGEKGAVLNSKGEVLFRKTGGKSSIYFTNKELELMRGQVFTHNHPQGRSLSLADVEIGAAYSMAEVRAVCDKWRYSVHPPKAVASAWDQAYFDKKIKPSVEKHEAAVRKELKAAVNSGKMAYREADELYWHEIWTRTAADTGIMYSRTTWAEKGHGHRGGKNGHHH